MVFPQVNTSQIKRFVNISGDTVENARFAIITTWGSRFPPCRALTVDAKYLDASGKELLKEHLRRENRAVERGLS